MNLTIGEFDQGLRDLDERGMMEIVKGGAANASEVSTAGKAISGVIVDQLKSCETQEEVEAAARIVEDVLMRGINPDDVPQARRGTFCRLCEALGWKNLQNPTRFDLCKTTYGAGAAYNSDHDPVDRTEAEAIAISAQLDSLLGRRPCIMDTEADAFTVLAQIEALLGNQPCALES